VDGEGGEEQETGARGVALRSIDTLAPTCRLDMPWFCACIPFCAPAGVLLTRCRGQLLLWARVRYHELSHACLDALTANVCFMMPRASFRLSFSSLSLPSMVSACSSPHLRNTFRVIAIKAFDTHLVAQVMYLLQDGHHCSAYCTCKSLFSMVLFFFTILAV
jgi:hypothetical protein